MDDAFPRPCNGRYRHHELSWLPSPRQSFSVERIDARPSSPPRRESNPDAQAQGGTSILERRERETSAGVAHSLVRAHWQAQYEVAL